MKEVKEVKTVIYKGEEYVRVVDVISTVIDMGHPKIAKAFAEMKDLGPKKEGT